MFQRRRRRDFDLEPCGRVAVPIQNERGEPRTGAPVDAPRPTGLTDQNNNQDVSNVQYNAANQIVSTNDFGGSETRQFNSLGQLTSLRAPGVSIFQAVAIFVCCTAGLP